MSRQHTIEYEVSTKMLIVKAKMWDEKLSEHFSLKEFRCRCDNEACIFTKVDMELVDLLEDIRKHIAAPLKVTSGYRCEAHNAALEGAAQNSYHIQGMAADVLIPNHFHKPLAAHYHDKYGIGFYNNRMHWDVRKGCARWGNIPK
jgi:uncharacterized protein YcbK (DUF882 family)